MHFQIINTANDHTLSSQHQVDALNRFQRVLKVNSSFNALGKKMKFIVTLSYHYAKFINADSTKYYDTFTQFIYHINYKMESQLSDK